MSLHNGFTPKMRPVSPRRSAIVAALDIGTSKVVCLIGRLKPIETGPFLPGRTHSVEVLGIGHQRSRGIKSGVHQLIGRFRSLDEHDLTSLTGALGAVADGDLTVVVDRRTAIIPSTRSSTSALNDLSPCPVPRRTASTSSRWRRRMASIRDSLSGKYL